MTYFRLSDHFGHVKLQKRGQTQSKTHYPFLVRIFCTVVGAGFAGRRKRLGTEHDRPDKFSVFSRLLPASSKGRNEFYIALSLKRKHGCMTS